MGTNISIIILALYKYTTKSAILILRIKTENKWNISSFERYFTCSSDKPLFIPRIFLGIFLLEITSKKIFPYAKQEFTWFKEIFPYFKISHIFLNKNLLA